MNNKFYLIVFIHSFYLSVTFAQNKIDSANFFLSKLVNTREQIITARNTFFENTPPIAYSKSNLLVESDPDYEVNLRNIIEQEKVENEQNLANIITIVAQSDQILIDEINEQIGSVAVVQAMIASEDYLLRDEITKINKYISDAINAKNQWATANNAITTQLNRTIDGLKVVKQRLIDLSNKIKIASSELTSESRTLLALSTFTNIYVYLPNQLLNSYLLSHQEMIQVHLLLTTVVGSLENAITLFNSSSNLYRQLATNVDNASKGFSTNMNLYMLDYRRYINDIDLNHLNQQKIETEIRSDNVQVNALQVEKNSLLMQPQSPYVLGRLVQINGELGVLASKVQNESSSLSMVSNYLSNDWGYLTLLDPKIGICCFNLSSKCNEGSSKYLQLVNSFINVQSQISSINNQLDQLAKSYEAYTSQNKNTVLAMNSANIEAFISFYQYFDSLMIFTDDNLVDQFSADSPFLKGNSVFQKTFRKLVKRQLILEDSAKWNKMDYYPNLLTLCRLMINGVCDFNSETIDTNAVLQTADLVSTIQDYSIGVFNLKVGYINNDNFAIYLLNIANCSGLLCGCSINDSVKTVSAQKLNTIYSNGTKKIIITSLSNFTFGKLNDQIKSIFDNSHK